MCEYARPCIVRRLFFFVPLFPSTSFWYRECGGCCVRAISKMHTRINRKNRREIRYGKERFSLQSFIFPIHFDQKNAMAERIKLIYTYIYIRRKTLMIYVNGSRDLLCWHYNSRQSYEIIINLFALSKRINRKIHFGRLFLFCCWSIQGFGY